MTRQDDDGVQAGPKKSWIEPEIRELDMRETFALIGGGADVGGNPAPDCQRS